MWIVAIHALVVFFFPVHLRVWRAGEVFSVHRLGAYQSGECVTGEDDEGGGEWVYNGREWGDLMVVNRICF